MLFRKAIYGQKNTEKKTNQNTTNQIKTTSSFCDDEQIQAVCFIICSPWGES